VSATFRILVVAVIAAIANAAMPLEAGPCNNGLNASQRPFKIYGDTYYVGTHGVASILVASNKGIVLIDGDLAESVPQIAANIRALGFHLGDVKLILNTHVHCDHAGGISELQRMTGAAVKASPVSAMVLSHGGVGRNDPQFGTTAPIAAVANVSTLADGETVSVGSVKLTAHFTPGHTPGGTTWTWVACEKRRCLHIVYADSLNAISSPGFRFTSSHAYRNALADFSKSFTTLSSLPCDILVTVHPEMSDLWTRLDARARGAPDALVDPSACRRYVERARVNLAKRVAQENIR
jgi:metallo-beta-lactamase class B